MRRAAGAYPRNYSAWQHRDWLGALLRPARADLDADLRDVTAWNDAHVSDLSALVYRQRVSRSPTMLI